MWIDDYLHQLEEIATKVCLDSATGKENLVARDLVHRCQECWKKENETEPWTLDYELGDYLVELEELATRVCVVEATGREKLRLRDMVFVAQKCWKKVEDDGRWQ